MRSKEEERGAKRERERGAKRKREMDTQEKSKSEKIVLQLQRNKIR